MSSFTDFLEEERRETIEKVAGIERRKRMKKPVPVFKKMIFPVKMIRKLDRDSLLRLFMLYSVDLKKDTLNAIMYITRPGLFPKDAFLAKKGILLKAIEFSEKEMDLYAIQLINLGRIIDEVRRRFLDESKNGRD